MKNLTIETLSTFLLLCSLGMIFIWFKDKNNQITHYLNNLIKNLCLLNGKLQDYENVSFLSHP